MSLRQLNVRLEGLSPLLLRNGNLANPRNPIARTLKALHGKRTKTDTDYNVISDIEWAAGWYFEDGLLELDVSESEVRIVSHSRPVLPAHVLDSMLVAAAKKSRLGPAFKSGVWVEGDAPLEIEPEKPLEEMFRDENFRFCSMEVVNQSKILRTRPYLKRWALPLAVCYDDTIVNEGQVEQALEVAGRLVGLCERRPRHGRFSVRRLS